MDTNWSWIVFAAIAIILWVSAVVLRKRRQRRAFLARYSELMKKYNDQQIVAAIMDGRVWQGMSQEQLIDSRGSPDDKDQTVYKTKTKQTWKYGRIGKNRFRERIYVENGTVVGWKE
jgi:ribosomal protein L21E